MSEKQWKQFVQLFGEKNQHLNKQQVLQMAKKPFQQLKQYYSQRGGENTDAFFQYRRLRDEDYRKNEDSFWGWYEFVKMYKQEPYTFLTLNSSTHSSVRKEVPKEVIFTDKFEKYLKNTEIINFTPRIVTNKISCNDDKLSCIDDKAVKKLSELLETNSSVTEITLSNNGITDIGAKALADMLKVNNNIVRLDLTFNKITDVGATALAEALKVNTSMIDLSLSHNEIGDEGATSFANILDTSSIQIINLGTNWIGVSGAEDLAEALKKEHKIKVLKMYNNPIGQRGTDALLEAIGTNGRELIVTSTNKKNKECVLVSSLSKIGNKIKDAASQGWRFWIYASKHKGQKLDLWIDKNDYC